MLPRHRYTAASVTLLAVALGACATLPPPTEQLAAARAAIDSADVAGAARVAPADINQAREKLNAAQLAVRDNDSVRAKRLAEESLVDAQLAQAKATSARSREGLAQAQAALRTLREEAARTPDTNATTPAAPTSTTVTPITPVTPVTPSTR